MEAAARGGETGNLRGGSLPRRLSRAAWAGRPRSATPTGAAFTKAQGPARRGVCRWRNDGESPSLPPMSLSFLARHEAWVYLVLRAFLGFNFAIHGAQKLFGVLGGSTPSVGSQIWIGGLIELVTGVLIGIGLHTRFAAFMASGTMAVAYTQFHWKLELGDKLFPVVNHGELAFVYAFIFLFIACRGPGRFALNQG